MTGRGVGARALSQQRTRVLQRQVMKERRLAATRFAQHEHLIDVAQNLKHRHRLLCTRGSGGLPCLDAIKLRFVVLVGQLSSTQPLGE